MADSDSIDKTRRSVPQPTAITSVQALRALTHPVRVRLLDAIFLAGSATATELAETIGDTPANCSWHLRQLAKFGYIEEAPGGRGRQRPWRIVMGPRSFGPSDDTELTLAGDAAADVLFDHELQAFRAWRASRAMEPPEWQHTADVGQSIMWLTADELRELGQDFLELMTRHLDRVDPANRPAGTRAIRVVAWAIPATPPPQPPA